MLAGPARHGWMSRDVNQLIRDWIGVRGWLPDAPHKPIGLLGAMLAWHGDLADRPAAADMAREAAELAAHRVPWPHSWPSRTEAAQARAVGRAAVGRSRACRRARAAAEAPPGRCGADPRRGRRGRPSRRGDPRRPRTRPVSLISRQPPSFKPSLCLSGQSSSPPAFPPSRAS